MVIAISRYAEENVEISNGLLHGERGLIGSPVQVQDPDLCGSLCQERYSSRDERGLSRYFQNRTKQLAGSTSVAALKLLQESDDGVVHSKIHRV